MVWLAITSSSRRLRRSVAYYWLDSQVTFFAYAVESAKAVLHRPRKVRPRMVQNEQYPASSRSTFRQVASLQRRRHASDLLTAFDAKVRSLLHRREDQKSGQNGWAKSRALRDLTACLSVSRG